MARRLLVLLCLWFVAALPAAARDFKVAPGDVPELRPGEGLLVVAIDSDQPVRSLKIRSDAEVFTGGRLDNIGKGSTMGLYLLPAGTYRWERLNAGRLIWNLRADPEGRFEVKAGQINYAGDLVFRHVVSMHIANRGLRVLDWLDREHPVLAQRYPFAYAGRYPDPFPAFYRRALAGAPAPADRFLPPPPPGPLPLAVRDLWREPRLQEIVLSPSGRYAASAVREDGDDWRIEARDLDAGAAAATALRSDGRISGLEWVADDILSAYVQTPQGLRLTLLRFAADGAATAFTLPRFGFLVDSLPGDEDDIVFASGSSTGEAVLHRLDVRHTAALAGYRFSTRERINEAREEEERWFVDGQGEVRAMVVERPEKDADGVEAKVPWLVYRAQAGFEDVLRLDDPELFRPLAVSADGALLYGISEKGRAQRELVEFDPRSRRITRTLFSRPGTDVVSALFDDARRPLGATFYENGQLVSEYFAEDRQRVAAGLGAYFADRTVAVLGRDRDNRRLLLAVDGSDQPARIFVLDRDAAEPVPVAETAPWLARATFAPSHTLRAAAKDGLDIEAFLTLPAGTGPRPLVVMPHGGPIGVADRRHFDPEVQFIASLGYAVLQVNFRGSDGYGRAFREAGRGGYGTAIEDDIDTAIVAALARFPLDGSRICIVGSSYGGYSGLVSAVRWPGRFRCVVSMSGVSDRVLFFTASDSGRSADGRAEMERLMGDPRTDLERMLATSPLFHVDQLDVPLLLVHGGEDIRVDYEHTRRLLRMLSLAGRPPVLLAFPDEGHGIVGIDNVETTWQAIAGFLRRHLGEAEAAPDAPP